MAKQDRIEGEEAVVPQWQSRIPRADGRIEAALPLFLEGDVEAAISGVLGEVERLKAAGAVDIGFGDWFDGATAHLALRYWRLPGRADRMAGHGR